MDSSNATTTANELQQLQALFNAAYLTRVNTYSQSVSHSETPVATPNLSGLAAAAIAVLAYDILLNLHSEVRLVTDFLFFPALTTSDQIPCIWRFVF